MTPVVFLREILWCSAREGDLEKVDVEVVFEESSWEKEGEEVDAQEGDEGVDKSFNLGRKEDENMVGEQFSKFEIFKSWLSTWSGEVPTKWK